VSWINLGYQEYLDHAIACQLTDQTECSRPANNTQPFEIITTFQQINACNSALLVLIWALGMPIKRFIGYYPDLVLVGESVDKNAFIQRIENTVWADTLPGFLQKKDGIPKILIGTSSHISPNEFPETVKIELSPTTQQPPPSLIAQWPVTEWLDFLCSINRSEFDDILGHCYQDYCHVTAPSVPDKVNNTVIMLLTWKLICLFLGHPLRWESNGEGVDDVDISIHSYV
jgi:hypothetical protein